MLNSPMTWLLSPTDKVKFDWRSPTDKVSADWLSPTNYQLYLIGWTLLTRLYLISLGLLTRLHLIGCNLLNRLYPIDWALLSRIHLIGWALLTSLHLIGWALLTLTDGLDDLCQKDTVRHVLLKVTDGVLVLGFLQVMVGPVCVYLQSKKESI